MKFFKDDEVNYTELAVVTASNVEKRAEEHWKLLGYVESLGSSREHLFLVGRAGSVLELKEKAAAAEAKVVVLARDVEALEGQLAKSTKAIASFGKERDDALNECGKLEAKLSNIERDVGLVRKEVGEAKWREILHSLQVEDVLAGTDDKTVDEDMPF